MNFRNQANLECSVSWNSDCASHTDCFCFQKIDFRRDILPGRIGEELSAVVPGEGVTGRFEAGEILPGFDESKHLRIHRNQWKPRGKPVYVQTPGVGRYYPRGFLSGIGGIHPPGPAPVPFAGRWWRWLRGGSQSPLVPVSPDHLGKG